MSKLIIRTALYGFLLYILWLFLFKGLGYIFPAYEILLNGFYDFILYILINPTCWLVDLIAGYHTTYSYNTILFNGHSVIIINNECLAVKLLSVFAILIIVLPGASWKNKMWYIPAGLCVIHLMNVVRMTVLSITVIFTPHLFNFMHSFVFRIIIYLTIIALWLLWMKYFMNTEKIFAQVNNKKDFI